MILWFILFFLIIAISFVLAYQSMKDYVEKPANLNVYSLYLIRNLQALTIAILDEIYSALRTQDSLISFEKLFKGQKNALVVFGPKTILEKFDPQLNLLELEDYTNVDPNIVVAWEMAIKDASLLQNPSPILKPNLTETEQFWVALVLQAKKGLLSSLVSQKKEFQVAKARENQKDGVKQFSGQIRAALVSDDPIRRKNLALSLENLGEGKLVKIPRPFTSSQLLESYKSRVLQLQPTSNSLTLTAREVLALLKI